MTETTGVHLSVQTALKCAMNVAMVTDAMTQLIGIGQSALPVLELHIIYHAVKLFPNQIILILIIGKNKTMNKEDKAHDYAEKYAKDENVTGSQMIAVYRAFLAGYDEAGNFCFDTDENVISIDELQKLSAIYDKLQSEFGYLCYDTIEYLSNPIRDLLRANGVNVDYEDDL